MFTHMANREAAIVVQNVFYGNKLKVDYTAVPHGMYSHPQIVSVGLTEEEARKNHKIMVGRTKYIDVAKGEAMLEKQGYVKAIIEKGTSRILGFHIIDTDRRKLSSSSSESLRGNGRAKAHQPLLANALYCRWLSTGGNADDDQ